MNAEEVRKNIARLNSMLKKVGLEWVVHQVSAVVGRDVERTKTDLVETVALSGQPMKGHRRRSETTPVDPLTELDELRLLAAAVRVAVVDVFQVQERMLSSFEAELKENPRIAFRPDLPEWFEEKGYYVESPQGGKAFDLSLREVQGRKLLAEKLNTLLAQFEEMIHAD